MLEFRFHHALVDSVHTRCARSAGCQRDARRFTQPIPVGNQSQESIKLALSVLRRPRRQLALHFTDYQRSSPHFSQLVHQASHFNCLPSPCDRLSRPRTTTEAPSACTSSEAHFLSIRAGHPSSHAGLITWARLPVAVFTLAYCKLSRTSRSSCALPVAPCRPAYVSSRHSRHRTQALRSATIRVLPVKRCWQG